MHNIRANYRKFYSICKELFSKETNTMNNFQFYPVRPKMNDLEIVALSCSMEAMGIDSENLLWSKLKTDYAKAFPRLIDRSRFNRRRRRLSTHVSKLQQHISAKLGSLSSTMVVDSIPVPVVKLVRERSYRAFKKDFDTAPAKGYSAVNRAYFIGYKLHLVIYDNGVVQQSGITKANVHDLNFLKTIQGLPPQKRLLGDRAYISGAVQADLFQQQEVTLTVPFRNNQHNYKKHPKKYRAMRQMVETVFAQLCDQFMLKRNYAKSYDGLVARLASKLSAMSILQWMNHLDGRKISKIKHTLCFQ